MKKIILFNGPPGSGKDEAASYCAKFFGGDHMEFKRPLLETALALSGFSEEEWYAMYNNRSPAVGPTKDTKLSQLHGLSQREFLITISERWVKPIFGEEHFGKVAANRVQQSKKELFFFSDSGFVQELNPLLAAFGEDNVGVIRLWRPGSSFKLDSRNYLSKEDCKWMVDVSNVASLDSFKRDVRVAVTAFLGENTK